MSSFSTDGGGVSGARSALSAHPAVARSIGRDQLLGGLFLLSVANGLAGRASDAVSAFGLSGALMATFYVSAIVWFACVVGLSMILRNGGDEPIRSADWVVGGVALLLVGLPFGPLSWVALTGLSLYALLTCPAGAMRRGAIILLAVTVPMLWGLYALAIFSPPFLWVDAAIVSNLIGTERIGNTVAFSDGSTFFQIFPACSSFHGMSLAALAWITVSQMVGRAWSWRYLLWCAAVGIPVFVVNVVRLALIGLYREHFDVIHGPVGAAVADWISIGLIVAICLLGVRREVFARA